MAYANAGYLSGAPALAYSAGPGIVSAATPQLGSTYHGRSALAAPAIAYGAAPALAYSAAPAVAYGAAPAITTQHQNILRSYGNLGQVSTYSRTIDTPYSSSSKSDVRVSNPGFRTIAAAPVYGSAIGAPLLRSSIAAPVYGSAIGSPLLRSSIASPVYGSAIGAPVLRSAVAAPAIAGLGVAYSAAPIVSHVNYASGYANYGW